MLNVKELEPDINSRGVTAWAEPEFGVSSSRSGSSYPPLGLHHSWRDSDGPSADCDPYFPATPWASIRESPLSLGLQEDTPSRGSDERRAPAAARAA